MKEKNWLDRIEQEIECINTKKYNEIKEHENKTAIITKNFLDYIGDVEIKKWGGISKQEMVIASLYHDTGKLELFSKSLKNEALSELEKGIMDMHPFIGADLWKQFPNIDHMIRYHHERPDGTGYPKHMKEIPKEASLLALADDCEHLSHEWNSDMVAIHIWSKLGDAYDHNLGTRMIQMLWDYPDFLLFQGQKKLYQKQLKALRAWLTNSIKEKTLTKK